MLCQKIKNQTGGGELFHVQLLQHGKINEDTATAQGLILRYPLSWQHLPQVRALNNPSFSVRYAHPTFPHEDDIVHVGPWDVGGEPTADWCMYSIECQFEVNDVTRNVSPLIERKSKSDHACVNCIRYSCSSFACPWEFASPSRKSRRSVHCMNCLLIFSSCSRIFRTFPFNK